MTAPTIPSTGDHKACTKRADPANHAWKICDTHGIFPVWYSQCPDSQIPTSGDGVIDMCIDMLLRPGTTLAERDWDRSVCAQALHGKPSRLDKEQ